MIKKISKRAGKATYNTFIPHAKNHGHPHIFKNASLLMTAVVTVLLIASIFTLTDEYDHTRLAADVYSALLVDLTNEDRVERNLPTLVPSERLALAAQLKAEDMGNKGYFAHTSPEGLSSWYWFSRVGYNFSYAGENLAVDFTESEDVSDAWMNSPTHRANISSSGFTEIGIATYDGFYKGDRTTFVVQMFGKPVYAFNETAPSIPVATAKTNAVKTNTIDYNDEPLVLGETSVVATSGDDTNSMVVIKNDTVVDLSSGEDDSTVSEPLKQYAPWYQKLLVEFSRPLGIALIVIGSMLGLTFLLSVIYHKTILKRAIFVAIIAFIIILSGFVYLSIADEVSTLLTIEIGQVEKV